MMASPEGRGAAPTLTDAAIAEAATAVREFEKAGIAPPRRLVAIAGRATATTWPQVTLRPGGAPVAE